jgi:copper chaperone CopZ
MAHTPVEVTYQVTGLTCGHCAGAVTAELTALPGVSAIRVDVVAGGVSAVAVSAAEPLAEEQVAAALDEAGGYRLVR